MATTVSSSNVSRSSSIATTIGKAAPLGATVSREGVNFSLFSRDASAFELLLFNREDDAQPTNVMTLDPYANRSYHYWHVFVPGIRSGQIYGYRVHGPFEPHNGLRFDADKLLLDPYGRGVVVPKTTTGKLHASQETTLQPR